MPSCLWVPLCDGLCLQKKNSSAIITTTSMTTAASSQRLHNQRVLPIEGELAQQEDQLLHHPEKITFSVPHRLSTSPDYINSSSSSSLTMTQRPFQDVLCRGCRLAKVAPPGPTCGRLIRQVMEQQSSVISKLSSIITDAAIRVSRQYPLVCGQCHPDACTDAEKQYWRMDQLMALMGGIVSTTLSDGAATPVVTHLAASQRLPLYLSQALQHDKSMAAAHQTISKFLSDDNSLVPKKYFMTEYNPVIVPLPLDQVPDCLPNDQPYYLALLRLASVHECFPDSDEIKAKTHGRRGYYPGRELVAFVIMDVELHILKQAIFYHQNLIDHRLFVLNGNLYLGFMHQITQIWINNPPKPSLNINDPVYKPMDPVTDPAMLAAPNDFQVTIRAQPHACCTSSLCQGKNFNYFTIPDNDNDQDQGYVEIKPANPHIVEKIDLNAPCTKTGRQMLLNIEQEITLGDAYLDLPMTASTSVFATSHLPDESFATTDEVYFPEHKIFQLPFTTERGNACCVGIPDPRGGRPGYLLVGIMHTKIPAWKHVRELRDKHHADFSLRQYSHRWYAFEPRPPFQLVAQSGKFCLGFPSSDQEMAQNPNNLFLRNKIHHFNHTDLECPLIEFVTSITTAVDDPEKVIVGYGLNDCVARFVKMEKSDISKMLGLQLPTTDAKT